MPLFSAFLVRAETGVRHHFFGHNRYDLSCTQYAQGAISLPERGDRALRAPHC